MKMREVSAFMLASLLTIGVASGQTPPSGGDPHHPADEEDTTAAPEVGAAEQPSPPDGVAGMKAMMSPDMMRMMMQMMALHHPVGQSAMPGMTGDMPSAADETSSLALGPGPEVILGLAPSTVPEMTPETVRAWMQDRLDRLGNPRLTLGAVGEAADGSITAEVRTVDGALVQKLAFNRFPGFVRQID